MIGLITFTYSQYINGYCRDTIPPGNVIGIYQAEYTYGDLNAFYAKSAGLQIDPDNYDRMILYEDIPDIVSMDGVENVILYDNSYIDEIYTAAIEDRLLDKLNLIAMPQWIAQNYINQVDALYGTEYLEEGRLPLDDAHEITISRKLLKKHFAYTDENLTQAIGSEVNYDNETYTIVGINSFDICFISFDAKRNYGFYQYDADSFDEFVTRNINYKKAKDFIYPEYANQIFIFTTDGSEKLVLDTLFRKYPAENYVSNQYVSVWKKSFNEIFLRKIIVIDSIVVALLGVILLLLNKRPIQK